MNVAVVIVSYNRLQLLKETINAVIEQILCPDKIIIVDNNSTDGTRKWLSDLAVSQPRVLILQLDRNLGGAGGFYCGMKKAYELGVEWIWTLDDDSIPNSDALKKLVDGYRVILDAGRSPVGFLSSQVNWKDGTRHEMNLPQPAEDWWGGCDEIPGCIKLRSASFVSILINSEAVKKVGYPIKEMFIWRDDVEFTSRITDAGFSNYYIEASKVLHMTEENVAMDYTRIDEKDLWKWKIGTRNHVALERSGKYGVISSFLLLLSILYRMTRNGVPDKIKTTIMLAGIKGLFYNYKKYIVLP